jgi:acetoin:2,6-dichlorophenolindophenol oxidoreductase subunit alpha
MKMGTKSESRSVRPKKKVATKTLKAERVQPANGNGASPSNHDVLRRMYVSMMRCRILTERVKALASDRQPTADYELAIGHEAIVVGATLELRPEDTIVASPRNFPAQVVKGSSLECLSALAAGRNGIQPVVATESSVAGDLIFDPFNLGTGLALTHRFEKRRNVVIALGFDDTSAPDGWREAMKFAGIHKLPIIYLLKRGSAFGLEPDKRHPVLDDLSFVARDCGFPAIIVDSNDAVAVSRVTHESIHRARNGAGPTLIECEVQLAHSNDPLAQMEHYMKKRGAWDDEWRRDAADRIEAELAGVALPGR